MRIRILVVTVLIAAGLVAAQQVTAAPACDTTWVGGNGNWATGTWDHGAPDDTKVACIPSGVTVTVNSAVAAKTLLGGALQLTSGTLTLAGTSDPSTLEGFTQSGGTLDGAATLQLTNGGTWSGGTMGGAGKTVVPAAKDLQLPTSTVFLAGTRLLDIAGNVLLATAQQGIAWNGGTPKILVEASGVLAKTVGSSTASPTTSGINIPVENDGKVESRAGKGVLNLSDGSDGTSTGTYGSAGALGTITLTGATHTLGDGAKLLDGAAIAGGTTAVEDAATATASNAAMTGGTLNGGGTFSITGPFTWSGGTMGGSGTTQVPSGVTVTLPTSTVFLADTRLLDVAGSVLLATVQQGIAWNGGSPRIAVGGTGVIRKTVGSTTANPTTSGINIPVENDGKIESVADKGNVLLSDGTGGTATGTYGSAGALGTVSLSTGTHALGDGAKLLDGAQIIGGTTTIPSGATVTATNARQTGGTVGGAGTLSISGGQFTWSGGTANGTGLTTVAAGSTLAIPSSVSLGDTRQLDVHGLMDLQNDVTVGGGLTAPIHVLAGGVMRKTAGNGTFGAFVGQPVQNDGLVETTSGILRLDRGTGVPSTGRFHGLDATHHVVLDGVDHALAGTATLDDFTELAGQVAIADGQTLSVPGEIYETGGTLTGDLNVTDTLHWDGGDQSAPGTTTVTPAGKILLDASCFNASLNDGRRLVNQGLVSFTNGSALSMGFGATDPQIENAGTMRFADASDANCSTGINGSGLLHNTGTLEKTGAVPATELDPALDNDGTVRSTAGALRLNGDGAFEQSGTFTSTGTGSYVFDQGVFLLAPGAAVQGKPVIGNGDLRIPEGMTLTVPAGATLRQEGGTVSGAGTLDVLGTLQAVGGEQTGQGTTVIEPGGAATLTGADAANPAFLSLSDSRALVNSGTLTVDNGAVDAFDGASITNRGTLLLRNASSLDGSGFGDGFASLLHNIGTLRKQDATTVEASIPIDNDGTIAVDAGKLSVTDLMNYSSDFVFGGPRGAIVGGEYLLKGVLGVPGDVDVIAGRVVLDGTGAGIEKPNFGVGDPNALAGLKRIAGNGALELAGGRTQTTTADAGEFSNAGVLRLAAGTVFNAVAGYAQAPGGVLRTEVPTAATAGKLVVTGPAALAGRLDVLTPHPPAAAVVTYDSHTGTFTTSGTGFTVTYDANAVNLHPAAGLVAREAAPPAVGAPEKGIVTEAAPSIVSAAALTVRGPWAQRGGYLVATRRGAELVRRGVSGRGLDIVAATGPQAGSVTVTWAGRTRTISLRAARQGRRTLRVVRLAKRGKGTVVVRTRSARRVAIASLVVRR